MSFAALPLNVIARSDITLSELRTYAAIASFASPSDPTCYPSRRAIADRLGGVHPDTITRSMRGLKAKGLIEVTQRRNRSSLYRLTPGPDTRSSGPDPTPGRLPDQTRNTRQEDSPNPSRARGEDDHVEILIQSVEVEPLAIVEETQVEALAADNGPAPVVVAEPAPSATSEPAEPPVAETLPEPAPNVTNASEPPQTRSERVEAAQRVVERLNAETGAQLDTRESSATVRRAARRLRHHTEQELIEVIEVKGREFRHPAALLKPSIIEAVLSERRQRETAEQRRRAQERETLEQVRPVAVNPEIASAGIAALRAALGCRLTC